MEVRVGVVSGAGRKGELCFAPAEERTRAHMHTHGHVELRVRITPKMYTHVHYSHTSQFSFPEFKEGSGTPATPQVRTRLAPQPS